MSKYFNEAVRIRNSFAVSRELTATTDVETPPQASETQTQRHLDPTRTTSTFKAHHTPLSEIVNKVFAGSDSLIPTQEAFRALRTRVLRLRTAQAFRSIVVTSSIQGEGKTLTSFNLAMSCAQLHDFPTLLIDSDIRTSGLSRLLGVSGETGLANVLNGTCEAADSILATSSPNLFFMPSGETTIPSTELLASGRWQELMSWCGREFQLVVVDSPPILDLTDVELISAACGGILMVVRAKVTRREALEKCSRHLDAKKLLGIVYNGAEGGRDEYQYSYSGTQR